MHVGDQFNGYCYCDKRSDSISLEAKLNEEVAEYQADKNLGEMADVLEVLQAICIARGYSLEELEALRAKKANERGGFADKIFLEYVE